MTTEETAKVSVTPVAIDYTSRDYYSIREDLISRVKERTGNSWFGTDDSDFGLALVEAFAYVGDLTAYYIDRAANEASLTTATQRNSIINLAKSYGYTPAGYQSATATFLLTNSSASSVTLPEKTEFSGSVVDGDVVRQIIFTTTSSVTVPANGTANVSARHGYFVSARKPAISENDVAGELLGTSSGGPSQAFVLSENQVVDDTITVYVQNGDTYGAWKQVLHLADYTSSDAVFTTSTDENNYVSIIFGDGVSGAIPPKNTLIKVDYLVGGGTLGNVAQYTIKSIYNIPGLSVEDTSIIASSLSVINSTAANGGINPDSLDTIKRLAPLAFTSLNRAVTLDDYTSLALQVPAVGKAKSKAEVSTSVTVYVAPRTSSSATDPYPLYDETNTTLTLQWDAGDGKTGLKYDVQNELGPKTQLGVSVTVAPPVYIPVSLEILYSRLPQYTPFQIETQIKSLLNTYYSYEALSFNETIYPEDIEFLLKYAPGILNVSVVNLYRSNETAGRKVLIGSENEIFSFSPTDVAITAASTVSTLSSLTTNHGTVSPVFSSTFYNYSLTIPNGTSSVDITPTASDGISSVVYVNGQVTQSGAAKTISTSTTTTTVTIKVVAQDLVTSKTYTLTITKA